MVSKRCSNVYAALVVLILLYAVKLTHPFGYRYGHYSALSLPPVDHNDGMFHWASVPQQYPVRALHKLPSPSTRDIPAIQYQSWPAEQRQSRDVRRERLAHVRSNFTHAWKGYKDHAWLRDEVLPISGDAHDPFGGWAATLVDSLDTLIIMELYDEFDNAVRAIDKIDFSTCALGELNVFETTIRYLGGFLSAYDLSGDRAPQLLHKARELGDMLYKAFDTPNRMPIMRWNFKEALAGKSQEAGDQVLVSEIGSLTLEFTRLSQLTGDMKYYDAVHRIMSIFEEQQSKTKLPGMWPVVVNAKNGDFADYGGFTIGGMADSLYEYLPKQHLLLGGSTPQYLSMYLASLEAMKRNIFYRPMTNGGEDIRLAGQTYSDGDTPLTDLKIDPEGQHLGCFAGGMVAIGAKIFDSTKDLELARKLVEGCLWAYEIMPLGIMPEILHTVACENAEDCPWDEKLWHEKIAEVHTEQVDVAQKILRHRLQPGIIKIDDGRYILRPEAIESVFILYRITGDESLRDRAWTMFENIIRHTTTDIAHAALEDVTEDPPRKANRMESFWLAETLKYFYLIFSEPSVISLDEYVLNTEAHPLRRPN